MSNVVSYFSGNFHQSFDMKLTDAAPYGKKILAIPHDPCKQAWCGTPVGIIALNKKLMIPVNFHDSAISNFDCPHWIFEFMKA